MSEWTERDRQAFVLVAACAYLASLFLAWWEVGIGDSENANRTMRIDGLGSGAVGTNRLSEFCVVIAVAILVFALAALRSHDHRLPLALRELAIALVIFTFVFQKPESARSSLTPEAPARLTRAISSSLKRRIPRWVFADPLRSRRCSSSPLPARLARIGW